MDEEKKEGTTELVEQEETNCDNQKKNDKDIEEGQENLLEEERTIFDDYEDLLKKFVNQCVVARDYTFKETKAMDDEFIRNLRKLNNYLDGKIEKTEEKKVEITVEILQVLNPMVERLTEIETMIDYLPNNLIVSIASNYDLFLSRLLKKIILDKNMVSIIGKELQLSEVVKYNTKEELISTCVDEFIDDLMRKSHKEQIQWIEKKFKIDIINSFNDWKSIYLFFEIRNVIVHNEAVVSRIFLGNLKKEGIASDKYEIGKKIVFRNEDIRKYIKTLIDFIVYLYSLVLKKNYNKTEDIEQIDTIINDVVYKFLCKSEYLQVISIVDYILRNNQQHSSADEFLFTINKCIALKARKNESYKKILDRLDWSNCDNKFRMAKAVLLEDYDAACKIMEVLDKDNMLQAYIEWPLFKEFVSTEEFKQKFRELYGIEFEAKMADISAEKAQYLSDKKLLEVEEFEVIEEPKEELKESKAVEALIKDEAAVTDAS